MFREMTKGHKTYDFAKLALDALKDTGQRDIRPTTRSLRLIR